MPEGVEAAFDDVAVLVEIAVVAHRSATAAALARPVADPVGGFGEHGLDPAAPQQHPVAPAAVGPVAQQRVGPGPCPPGTDPWDLQGCQQYRQHRAVVGVARADMDGKGPATTIDQRVELGRQAAAGPADRVVDGFSRRTLVVPTPDRPPRAVALRNITPRTSRSGTGG